MVFHRSRLGAISDISKLSRRDFAALLIDEVKRARIRHSLYSKSVGYHSFNLYAFALLRNQFPNHSFWVSSKFSKMLSVTQTEHFLKLIDESAYSWPYNPPGIECAFAGEVFGLGNDYCQKWINRQYERTFNHASYELLTHGVPDQVTSSARIYEAVRLSSEYILPAQEVSTKEC